MVNGIIRACQVKEIQFMKFGVLENNAVRNNNLFENNKGEHRI
jgi:hypothetical protein